MAAEEPNGNTQTSDPAPAPATTLLNGQTASTESTPPPRYFANDDKLNLRTPRRQLIAALQDLVRKWPPSAHDPDGVRAAAEFSNGGFYHGEVSVALLLMGLNEFYADVELYSDEKKEKLPFSVWLVGYLKVISAKSEAGAYTKPTVDDCGVRNSTLASIALKAALAKDAEAAIHLCTDFLDLIADPEASNEWLCGRAGYLYMLRLVRASFKRVWDDKSQDYAPETEEEEDARLTVDETIADTVRLIMDSPRPWKWHGKHRLGAAHGDAGIITQIILAEPRILSDPEALADPDADDEAAEREKCRRYSRLLQAELGVLLSYQLPDGNWPSSVPRGIKDLVQFCHGAPGIVSSLLAIRKAVTAADKIGDLSARIDVAIDKGRALIWEKGLLTKEPCLCHGISGNALTLKPDQFEHFLSHTTLGELDMMREDPRFEPTSKPRYGSGLYTGIAGRCWAWAVADCAELQRRFLGYNDV